MPGGYAHAQTRRHEGDIGVKTHLVPTALLVGVHLDRPVRVPLQHEPVQNVPWKVATVSQRDEVGPRQQALDGLPLGLGSGHHGIELEALPQLP